MRMHSNYVRDLLEEARPLGRDLRPLASQLREAEALQVPFADMHGRTRMQAYYILFRRFSRRLGALAYPRMPHPELGPLGLPEIPADERQEAVRRLRESTVAMPSRRRTPGLALHCLLDMGISEEELFRVDRKEADVRIATRLRGMTLDNVAAMRKMPRELLDDALEDRQPMTYMDAETLARAQFNGWTAQYTDGAREHEVIIHGVELSIISEEIGAPVGMQVLSVYPPKISRFGPAGFLSVMPVRASILRLLTPPNAEEDY